MVICVNLKVTYQMEENVNSDPTYQMEENVNLDPTYQMVIPVIILLIISDGRDC
jgi:hypothetical protein